jgi:protein-L-isoaspartate(D-aspartate) O-methyltransferase
MSDRFAAEALPIEERAALALQLRSASVRDVAVMNAFERVPREFFTPHRFRDLANRNMALPIGCGQTMPAPADLARRLEALGAAPDHRVLEIGAGSGYSAAVLSRLAKEVMSIERFETLAIEAASRLSALAIGNALVLCADGLAPARSMGLFDRIIIHLSLDEPPMAVLDLLAPGGVMVFGRFLAPPPPGARREARLIRLERSANGELFSETDKGPCRLRAAFKGRALAL